MKWTRRLNQSFYPLAATVASVALAWPGQALALSINEYPGLKAGTAPNVIAVGPDGALWYTEFGTSNIGRITTAGIVTEFATPAGSAPYGITAGPDGNLWITDQLSPKIRRMTPSGTVTEFTIPSGNTSSGITAGADGNLWFTEQSTASIGRVSTSGAFLELPINATTGGGGYQYSTLVTSADGAPTTITKGPDNQIWFTIKGTNAVGRVNADTSITEFPTAGAGIGITSGPDGALWFVEEQANKIGRITTGGTLTEYPVPTANSLPFGIATGIDGALWFAEFGANKIGRITTGGSITETLVPTPNSSVYTIVEGPDSALWFTESDGNRIGRLDPNGSPSPLVAAVLPTSRSVTVGATATAFATMINGGTSTATGCAIAPVTSIPATFAYQPTNSATNAAVGAANTPVTLAAGAAQSFIVSFATTAQFNPTDTVLNFSCGGVPAAASNSGLNTILLSASTTATPDVVALAATTSGDGTVHIPGTGGTGAFAVATVNVGASGSITASADTGVLLLPVAVTLCQTDPTSGQCISSIGPSVATTINAGQTPTFAIFAAGSGDIPFAPASGRIFVRFKDSGGATRGSTSVAVTTH